ncbi:TraB/GumN family protein [Pseudoruegeria sp. HB172150]|uniref:TraB/GumN family protein n=1 Tax=Pseudoruegeria sp. HB172150 TaxID=2721164 RepID=UPI001553E13F|nr:TraB/GumN family protein [Pseudoruegeria sp. HB172150]
MRRLLVCLLILLAGPAAAQCTGTDLIAAMPEDERLAMEQEAAAQPYSEGILWRAAKDGRSIHLVGTMHTYDSRHQATLDRIAPFLENAKTVLMELGEGDEARLQRMIAETPDLAFITEGPTLPELLSKEDWDALRVAMSDRGIPGFLAAKMKPWMAMANLSISKCMFQDLLAGRRGLDAQLMERAAELGRPAVALEPLDTALKLFGAYSEEEQLDLLRLALAQQDAEDASYDVTVAEAYFREDVLQIWLWSLKLMEELTPLPPEEMDTQIALFEDLLLTARNRAWIDEILTAEGDTLVAVGAMHLPGDEGVLNLLEQEGFEITRLPLTQ